MGAESLQKLPRQRPERCKFYKVFSFTWQILGFVGWSIGWLVGCLVGCFSILRTSAVFRALHGIIIRTSDPMLTS